MAEEKNKSIRELRQQQRRMKAKQKQAEFMTIKNSERLARKFGAPASEIAALKKAGDASGMEKLARQYASMGSELSRLPEFNPIPPTKPKNKKMNKGGYGGMAMKKPEMMKGGMYKGKKHMYAAGGLVKEIKM